MAQILHLAPAGTGKTARLLALLREMTQSKRDGMPKIWVLLATRRQALNFRQRLIELDENVAVYCNIEYFNFYSLNARLLKYAGTPVRRLSHLTRYGLLRRLLSQMRAEDQLRHFQRIADTRGFASIVAELIDELKQAKVDVDEFAAAARSQKDEELALIYRRYQDTLRRSDLADVEGEGWLALAKLRDLALDVDLLLVDGYDQFTIVQAQMLAALSRAIPHVHISLTRMPIAFADALPHRSALARRRLEVAFEEARVDLRTETIDPFDAERASDLMRLGERIFRARPAAAGGAAIKLIEMPSPNDEARSVLRLIKRQLLEGVKPDDILVALRDWNRYAAHFASIGDEFGLPLLLRNEPDLHSAPMIAVLIDLLDMAPRFRRRDLLDILRSPYIDAGLDPESIDLLDRISLERQFRGGDASEWLDFVTLAGRPAIRDSDADALLVLDPEQQERLFSRLSAFFDALRPPVQADVPAYVEWLDNLLGLDPFADYTSQNRQVWATGFSLNIIAAARQHEPDRDRITRQDLMAWSGLKRILRDFSARDDVLRETFGEAAQINWPRFWSDLKQALESTTIEPGDRSRAGQVLVTTAAEARGLPHGHVYVLGLSEGLFPAEVPEDPLYLDSERERLRAHDIPLAAQADRFDDQGLFYELISLPQESLTLSRPTFQAGKVWIESHLWRAVRRVYPDLAPVTGKLGAVVPALESASGSEALLGVASQLNGIDPKQAESALRVKNWLRHHSSLAPQWRRIETGRRVELGRLSNAPFDRYSGILTRPDLLAEVARRLGRERVWSASQLNDYGLCGFRFFAKRLLKLDEFKEPELGMDAAQLGSLNHRILEETYRAIAERALGIEQENRQAALEIFAGAADDILDRAPDLFSFRATATWQEEKQVLRNRLLALIKNDFSPESPLKKFGDRRYVYDLELKFNDVEIELPAEGRTLRVAGYIDRIDNVDGKLIVIDYKSGTTAIERREMEIGRDFQMMVYALALQGLLERNGKRSKVAGGLFWHVRNLKASGRYSADDEDDIAALELARQHVARNLAAGRAGQFPARATALEDGKCARYCEFSHFCRMRVTSPYKAAPPA
ncbi:MAG: PD-(D/E)XK nuclease family protein [Chloroflexi bacterium]|nr:PD-(D/E)XK nuclease family protein [Chloroflexota bacterium]